MSFSDKMLADHLDKVFADDAAIDREFDRLIRRNSTDFIGRVTVVLVPFVVYAVIQLFRHGTQTGDYLGILFTSLWVFIYKFGQFYEIALRATQQKVPWWLLLRYWTDYCWASFVYLGIIRPFTSLSAGITVFQVLIAVAFFLLSIKGYSAHRNLNRLESIVRAAEKYPDSKRRFLEDYYTPMRERLQQSAVTATDKSTDGE
jgi:hypothetical protein